jgi:peptidoglycan/LPS O-acetylase OafA/YrhL
VLEGTVRGLSLGPDDLRDLLVDTPVSVGFALLIAAVALARVPGEQIVSRGPLQWYGRHSYGLYLWHFPVIYVLRSLEIWPDHLAVALAMTVAPATALAVLSWHLLERPAIAWARRRTPARVRGPLLATAASGD